MFDEMPRPNPPPTPSWSELPPELILTISSLLTSISDSIRFRSVCSSWRNSSSSPSPSPSPGRHFPWLAFPNPCTHCAFLSLVTSNSLSLPLGGPHQLLGSSDGLLILRSPATNSLSLLNPLTGPNTPLPSLKTFPNSPFFIKKLVLASVPTSAALALLGWSNNLALYRPESNNSSWILIKGGCTYHDALYHSGRFHVVDGFRRVFALNCDDGQLTEVARVVIARAPPFIGREEKCYLVEMDGDLLLVVRNYVNKATTGFEVFKLMMETGGSSIELKGLGNRVLFLGLNRAMSMMAESEDGGVFGGNCVYFLDDGLNAMGDVAGTFGDAGVFDVGDGSIEPLRDFFADFESIRGRQPAVWFAPSLC